MLVQKISTIRFMGEKINCENDYAKLFVSEDSKSFRKWVIVLHLEEISLNVEDILHQYWQNGSSLLNIVFEDEESIKTGNVTITKFNQGDFGASLIMEGYRELRGW